MSIQNATGCTTLMTKYQNSSTQWHVNKLLFGQADSKKLYVQCHMSIIYFFCTGLYSTGTGIQKNVTVLGRHQFFQKLAKVQTINFYFNVVYCIYVTDRVFGIFFSLKDQCHTIVLPVLLQAQFAAGGHFISLQIQTSLPTLILCSDVSETLSPPQRLFTFISVFFILLLNTFYLFLYQVSQTVQKKRVFCNSSCFRTILCESLLPSSYLIPIEMH